MPGDAGAEPHVGLGGEEGVDVGAVAEEDFDGGATFEKDGVVDGRDAWGSRSMLESRRRQSWGRV